MLGCINICQLAVHIHMLIYCKRSPCASFDAGLRLHIIDLITAPRRHMAFGITVNYPVRGIIEDVVEDEGPECLNVLQLITVSFIQNHYILGSVLLPDDVTPIRLTLYVW